MTKRFRMILFTLCALVLVFACAMAFADEPQAEEQDVVITDIDVPAEILDAENTSVEENQAPVKAKEEESATAAETEQPAAESRQEEVSAPEETEEVVSESHSIEEALEEAEEQPIGPETEEELSETEEPAEGEAPGEDAEPEEDENPAEGEGPAEDEESEDDESVEEEPEDDESVEEEPDEDDESVEEEPDEDVESADEEPDEDDESADEEPDEDDESEDEEPDEDEEPVTDEEGDEDELPADDEEETPAEEEPEEEEELPLLNLNGQKTLSGVLTKRTPVSFKVSDIYSRKILFTLAVQQKDAVKVTVNDTSVILTQIDNPDPASSDLLYVFEKQMGRNQEYVVTLFTEQGGYIPFDLKLSEKKEPEATEQEETAEPDEEESEEEPAEEEEEESEEKETAEETENAEAETEPEDAETVEEGESEEADAETESGPETEETESRFTIPEDRSVDFDIFFDEAEPTIGCIAHFKAQLTGYEGIIYKLQWQKSIDCEEWFDEENADQETMDVLMTEESCQYYWRLKVIIDITENA